MTHDHIQPTPPDRSAAGQSPGRSQDPRPHRPYRQRTNRPAGPITLSCGPLEPRHVRQLARVVDFERWDVIDARMFASQWLEWCGLRAADQATVLGLWLHPQDREPVLVGGAGLLCWPAVARVMWLACYPPYRAAGLVCLTDQIVEHVPLDCPLVSCEPHDTPYGDQMLACGWRRGAAGQWWYAAERLPQIRIGE